MFKIFKDVSGLNQSVNELETELSYLKKNYESSTKALGIAVTTLEDYLDIEFFHGDKSKPHYRKKRVIKRPVGRPRKKK